MSLTAPTAQTTVRETTGARPPRPPQLTGASAASLRADLERSGWTVEGVAELLGPVAEAAMRRDSLLPARRAAAAAGDDPVAVLTRLFLLAGTVTRAALDAALPATGTAGAEAVGLVEAAGGSPDDAVRAVVDLRPHAAVDALGEVAWWVASDLGEHALPPGQPLPSEHVLGIGGASASLAKLAVRTPAQRVLDIGTGSGVQALHATRHARAVTATDTSARALGFAAFNAALAGVELDLRRGSLLEPVAEERFDQVVSNPPFVVTPRAAGVPGWEYRDGGLVGDAVVEQLVTGLGAVLAPGGSAQMLGNWEHRRGEGWQTRVQGWLDASGLDGWVVQREVMDPAHYAETWIRDGGQRPGPEADALLEAWLDDFAARGVEAVGLGFVVLHAPAADAASRPRWTRVEEVTGPLERPLGEHVAAVLAARKRLVSTDDDALLAARLRVADDVTEERHARPGEGGPRAVLLRAGGGLGRVASVGTALAGLVGACDGELQVGQVVQALAVLLDVDAAALRAELVPQVRGLVEDGFLEWT
ncbi:Methyltransferase small domain-containing protein [Quadrisphaera granulorum]|uniref:Methyltransferase family protein n=1 Tax=Quadrisphaera granulorum TaxID=317664 RepID=A0A316A645_9ACTN|nr:methyltransferase [Quadrisphaera granulorum]PWJ53331.1 methyltransferase family protein [Quadrisphaera granulorum]SZE97005.1 Methyltransferase small domain-containing protein [Quadrisphaera granulorum]